MVDAQTTKSISIDKSLLELFGTYTFKASFQVLGIEYSDQLTNTATYKLLKNYKTDTCLCNWDSYDVEKKICGPIPTEFTLSKAGPI